MGAAPRSIAGLVVRRGLLLCSVGLGLGLTAAAGLTRLLSNVLYGVAASDPITFLVAPVGASVVGVVASLVPAWRALRVEPMVALRSE